MEVNFEVSFQVIVNSAPTERRGIFRLTNSLNETGAPGDRILVLTMDENRKFIFNFPTNIGAGNEITIPNVIALQTVINVTVKQINQMGAETLQIFLDGTNVKEESNNAPIKFENVNAYASDQFYRPVDGNLTNLKIFPGKFYLVSMSFCTQ